MVFYKYMDYGYNGSKIKINIDVIIQRKKKKKNRNHFQLNRICPEFNPNSSSGLLPHLYVPKRNKPYDT